MRVALAPREAQVADLAARGLGNKQIGRQLGVSDETVKEHLARVYRKLGVAGRDGLMALRRDGLLEP